MWRGGKGAKGYGRKKIGRKLYLPHRIAWVIANGAEILPDGSYHGPVVMHSCDNSGCCNPRHLVLGSQQQNVDDMMRKGRKVIVRNEAHPFARLSDDTVAAIKAHPASSRATARVFGCSDSYVRSLRRGEARTCCETKPDVALLLPAHCGAVS